jgi:hypothetical protein
MGGPLQTRDKDEIHVSNSSTSPAMENLKKKKKLSAKER